MLRLMVKDSAGNLFEYPLDFDELTVGRDDSCDVILDAPNVSRKHARFFFDQEGFLFVEDMDSSTGTIVDGEAITEPTAIDENSKVLVGSFILFLDFAEDQDSEEFYEFETDSADEAARLVVLNGPDRGAEYPLTADFIPIGKAGTNAIVLDHPSLSPEHAQIIREGDAYVLQDLASSSGTRVNGKEIEEVALRDGDLIQLGSLKLRFMYDREVTRRRSVAKLAMELKQRWKVLVPGLAVVFLLLILIVTIASPGGEAGSNDSETGLEQPPEEVESALVKAKNMLSEGKFDKAEALIQKVLEQDPLNDTASKLKQRLEQERKNEKLYNEASMLFDLGRKKEAREAFEKIPTNSRFYKLAKPKIDELNEHLSRIFFEQGRRAYRRGRYRVAHDLLVKYLEIKPDSPHAIEWVKDCEKNLKKKGVKFEPYIPPEGHAAAGPDLSGVPPVLRSAYKRYYSGDIDEALKILERLVARHRVKGDVLAQAEQARKLMLVVRGKFTSGQSALYQGRMDDARQEWSKALEADERLLPKGSPPSFFAREISNNLARGYIEKAQDALSKEQYEEAFDSFQKALKASPDEIIAMRGLLKLERVAARLLDDAKSAVDNDRRDKAARLCKRALAITRKKCAVHKEAEELLKQMEE